MDWYQCDVAEVIESSKSRAVMIKSHRLSGIGYSCGGQGTSKKVFQLGLDKTLESNRTRIELELY